MNWRPRESSPSVELGRIARQRRHTLYFLRYARAVSPVFLDTDVDMSRIIQHRALAKECGQRFSFVCYVIQAGGRVLARWPEANSAAGTGLWPRLARFGSVDAKLALDKVVGGQRIVASVPLVAVQAQNLAVIQEQVDRYRDTPLEVLPAMRGILMLQRLPAWLGWSLFALNVSRLRKRSRFMGTFAVSSLGHRPVNGFHAVGGTPITLNLGQIRDAPVWRDGRFVPVPTMRLNMSFDHRVIDGGMAADILTDIRAELEQGVFA